MNRKSKATLFVFSTLLSFAAQAQQLDFWKSLSSAGEPGDFGTTRISISAYNLENLFDTIHDQGKNDYARLPKRWKDANPDIMRRECERMSTPYYKKECYELDWSEEVLHKKLQNMGRSIRAMNNGKGPDILVVEEVENIKVLTALRDQTLFDLGYETVLLIEGPDSRGIDVGILAKFPVVDAQLHIVDLSSPVPQPTTISMEESLNPEWSSNGQFMLQQAQSGGATRGILEATFKVGNRMLTVFGNHWPSQAAPTEQRARAAWTLYQAASKAYDLKRDVVALGDFNTIESENPNPFTQYLMNPRNPLQFMDASEEFSRRYGRDHLAPGSHFYQGKWSFLDRFFILKQSSGERMENDWKGFGVNAPDFVLENRRSTPPKPKGMDFDLFGDIVGGLVGDLIPGGKVPMRFDPGTGAGFSDHLALVGTMSL
jgi:hypothetical protein